MLSPLQVKNKNVVDNTEYTFIHGSLERTIANTSNYWGKELEVETESETRRESWWEVKVKVGCWCRKWK
jgi:hypothetical protein